MPVVAKRAEDPDGVVHLVVRVPGWLKNRLLDVAGESGVSLNGVVLGALFWWEREVGGFPRAPVVGGVVPSVVDEVRAYLLGVRLSGACGRVGCVGLSGDGVLLGGVEFCGECGVRLG